MTQEMKVIIRWEEPPPARGSSINNPKRQQSCWDDVAEALKHEAPASAVIFEGTRGAADSVCGVVARGRLRCFYPAGSFEAVTRQSGKGPGALVTVFARYVGDGR